MVSIVYPSATMAQSRPSAGLKRDSSHLSSPSSSDSYLANQAKRLKVAFDDKIDIRTFVEESAKPQDLVREEVRSAIECHLRPGESRNEEPYEQLRTVLVRAAVSKDHGIVGTAPGDVPDNALLKQYIAALLGRVNDLKGCGSLVHAILDINWFGRDETVVALYVRFLGALTSAMPGFLKPAMEKMVCHFTYLPSSLGRGFSNEANASQRQMIGRLHNALRYLLRLIPSAVSSLVEVMRHEFPNHRMTKQRHYLSYIRNLFRITEYAPELSPRFWL